GGHPRDGIRPRGLRPCHLYGRGSHRGGGAAGADLLRAAAGAHAELPTQGALERIPDRFHSPGWSQPTRERLAPARPLGTNLFAGPSSPVAPLLKAAGAHLATESPDGLQKIVDAHDKRLKHPRVVRHRIALEGLLDLAVAGLLAAPPPHLPHPLLRREVAPDQVSLDELLQTAPVIPGILMDAYRIALTWAPWRDRPGFREIGVAVRRIEVAARINIARRASPGVHQWSPLSAPVLTDLSKVLVASEGWREDEPGIMGLQARGRRREPLQDVGRH